MTRITRLTRLASTLSFKLFVTLFFFLFVVFAAYTMIWNVYQRGALEAQVKADAALAGDLIRQSLYTNMLRNERERTAATVQLIGEEPGVEAVRIYAKSGEIRYSGVAEEIGTRLDPGAESCRMCHESTPPLQAVPIGERGRIYRRGGAHRVLALVSPIRNEESCWTAACHAHSSDESILGLLDIEMSMEALDEALASSRQHALGYATTFIFLMMVVLGGIIYRAVHVPAHKLREGTEALARGDLAVEIDIDRSDELGALADSFNHMAKSLKAADEERRAWSERLEERVRRKTEELQRIHQKMIQVEKSASLGTMAASVAHELNNPLSGILTCAKLVAKRVLRVMPEGEERDRTLDNLELIRSESARCGRIVRDLLIYARHGTEEYQEAELNALVDQALKLVGHHVGLSGIETLTELRLEDGRILCDRQQIVQALIALMINAVEAMPHGGQLTIATWESERDMDRVYLSVSDTGVGIPREAIGKIFDPFFSTKDEAKGVGLGLAVVHGIVLRHAGEISVTSTPKEGTQFTIQLPRDPRREDAERESGAQGARVDSAV